MVEVFEFRLAGTTIGCGTRAEFQHWVSAGVLPAAAVLGEVIAQEDAAEDQRRTEAWTAL